MKFADDGGKQGNAAGGARTDNLRGFLIRPGEIPGSVGKVISAAVNAGDRSVSMQVCSSSSFLSCCPWELMSVKLPLTPSCLRGGFITIRIRILIGRNISCS